MLQCRHVCTAGWQNRRILQLRCRWRHRLQSSFACLQKIACWIAVEDCCVELGPLGVITSTNEWHEPSIPNLQCLAPNRYLKNRYACSMCASLRSEMNPARIVTKSCKRFKISLTRIEISVVFFELDFFLAPSGTIHAPYTCIKHVKSITTKLALSVTKPNEKQSTTSRTANHPVTIQKIQEMSP
jgi:hypothetical protein